MPAVSPHQTWLMHQGAVPKQEFLITEAAVNRSTPGRKKMLPPVMAAQLPAKSSAKRLV
jgi:hypothetical protein